MGDYTARFVSALLLCVSMYLVIKFGVWLYMKQVRDAGETVAELSRNRASDTGTETDTAAEGTYVTSLLEPGKPATIKKVYSGKLNSLLR